MSVPTIARIKAVTAEHFGLSVGQLVSRDRSRRLALPRQMAMWLACRWTECSLSTIAHAFRRTDHSTVIHARDAMDRLTAADSAWHDHATQIERRVLSRAARPSQAAGD